jgi:hypothetical protein
MLATKMPMKAFTSTLIHGCFCAKPIMAKTMAITTAWEKKGAFLKRRPQN